MSTVVEILTRLRRRIQKGLTAFTASTLLIHSGCAIDSPLRLNLQPEVDLPTRSAIVLWADGMDHQRFDDLLASGRLPNIKRVFVDGGVTVENGVDTLPSQTYINGASLITGRFAGRHGITGNLWLDRQTLDSVYYLTLPTYLQSNEHLAGPTLFEILGDLFTLNIHCHTRRGVTHSIDLAGLSAFCFGLGAFITSDRLMCDRLTEAAAVANQVKRWPSVLLIYGSGVDETGHLHGPDAPLYTEAIENIDTIVGRIDDAIENAGLKDRTYFILVSDHGMSPVRPDRINDLQKWLQSHRRLRVRCEPLTGIDYGRRLRELDHYDVFLAIGSDRAASIHIRGRAGWQKAPEPAEIEAFLTGSPSLIDIPAVDCAVFRDGPDRVRVLSSRGSAAIERRANDGIKTFRITELTGDPLGYEQDGRLSAFVAAGWHTSREWLAATAEAARPDFVPQVVEMFDSPRMGDCVLFAADEAAFSNHWRGGHGSCLRRDMHVVQLWAGPDLPAGGSIPYSRLVDVAPTIIGLLGEADRLKRIPSMDGVDLSKQIKTATPKRAPDHLTRIGSQ
ncbi:MAG TPA: alkaline phosphatase family protein [Phycisphaerae bacterium]|nr:alkaline phosphatase family protein [Phycisphaerae bacterium]